jgi:hypothetical protein
MCNEHSLRGLEDFLVARDFDDWPRTDDAVRLLGAGTAFTFHRRSSRHSQAYLRFDVLRFSGSKPAIYFVGQQI